jgi:hypothetical protein
LCSVSSSDVLTFHVRSQNAAVIFRKSSQHIIVESFEVQPPTAIVMGCTGKLVRVFPESAVQVPNAVVDGSEAGFFDQVSNLLSSMDTTEFNDAVATSWKAGSDHRELRDSTNPKYILEFFMAIMRGYGEVASTRMVRKRTADDVLWEDARRPWRRSPVWFIIRVMLHTSVLDPLQYKKFMVFLHAQLVRHCAKQDLDSDLLYSMRAKMARRLDKLRGHNPSPFIITCASDAADKTQDVLRTRWDAAQEEDRVFGETTWTPEKLASEKDLVHTLPNCGKYLREVLRQEPLSKPASDFTPTTPKRLRTDNFRDYANSGLKKEVAVNGCLALADFEAVVQYHLDSWIEARLMKTQLHLETCEIVTSCILQYHDAAETHYSVDVVDRSIYVLTIVDLWTALDRVAVKDVPLLREFSPEIPRNFLHPLLLRSRDNIERSAVIEQYIQERHTVLALSQSVFSDSIDGSAFALRFFEATPSLQELKSKIEKAAQEDRNEKIAELDEKNAEYCRLAGQASSESHSYVWNSRRHREEHASWCEKCRLNDQVEQIRRTGIEVHEWPLPSNETKARRVVFELAAPKTFQMWRSMTYMILTDIGNPSLPSASESPQHVLSTYNALEQYSDLHRFNRISIASNTKSVLRSHYSTQTIPATQRDVRVNNGLNFALYDEEAGRWTAAPFKSSSSPSYGTLQLQCGSPYKYLQYAVDSTLHTTNSVIANRSDCPSELSLLEHDAFGGLRSGGLYGLVFFRSPS